MRVDEGQQPCRGLVGPWLMIGDALDERERRVERHAQFLLILVLTEVPQRIVIDVAGGFGLEALEIPAQPVGKGLERATVDARGRIFPGFLGGPGGHGDPRTVAFKGAKQVLARRRAHFVAMNEDARVKIDAAVIVLQRACHVGDALVARRTDIGKQHG